jgi:transporter family protein
MSQQTIGLIIGGLIPAIILGISSLLQKIGSQSGPGAFLILSGAGIMVVGIVASVFITDVAGMTTRSGVFSLLFGIVWGLATIGVVLAMGQYGVPVGKLVPLLNMNTLVAVVLALWIFSEWKTVGVSQLMVGAVLIVAGGVLVARA